VAPQPSAETPTQAPGDSPARRRRLCLALLVALVGLANALLTSSMPLLQQFASQSQLLSALISTGDVHSGDAGLAAMSHCLAIKFVVTVLVLALPLPMGAIAPAFVIGALIGRVFGEIAFPLCTSGSLCLDMGKEDFVAQFALVGASAFVAGSMRSFAQVIIVFERTSLPQLLLPLCGSSLAAIFLANAITFGFFDSLIMLKRLPHLPSLARGRHALTVADVMTQDIPILMVGAEAAEVERMRARYPRWLYEVPVVTHLEPGTASASGISWRGSPVLVSALKRFPSGAVSRVSLTNSVVPLLVPCHATVKSLLPLLASLEKTVAFVVEDSHLVGAVTLTDLYSRACDR